MNASILIVDDERRFRVMAEEALVAEGFDVRSVPNLGQAREEVRRFSPDIILLDRRLPDGDGIDYLTELRTDGPGAPIVVVVTAYADVESAVAALRAGAWNYLSKPVQLTDLMVKLGKVLEARGLRDRLALARSAGAGPPLVPPRSAKMLEVVARLRSLSQSPATPLLILGHSGAGKGGGWPPPSPSGSPTRPSSSGCASSSSTRTATARAPTDPARGDLAPPLPARGGPQGGHSPTGSFLIRRVV